MPALKQPVLNLILRVTLLSTLLPLLHAQFPDAPSAVKQRQDSQKLPFCQMDPLSPLCVVFHAPQEVPEYLTDVRAPLAQPTFCDIEPSLPVCSGFMPSPEVREHEVALRRRLVIPDGTPVQLRLSTTLNSKSVKPGDPVELEVFEDVKVHDAVVIPRHARAWATADLGTRKASNAGVDFARFVWSGKSDGNGGQLVLEVSGLWAITGETVHLRGWTKTQGNDAYLPPEGGILTLALMFVVKGDNIEIPRGAKITAFVDGNVSLDEALARRIVPYTDQERQRDYAARRNTSIVHVYRTAANRSCPEASLNAPSEDSSVDDQTSRTQLVVQSELFCGEVGHNYRGKPRIFLDGREVARLGAGRYASLEVPAGEHLLRTDDNEVALRTHPGSEDYLRLSTRGVFTAKGRLDVMDERSGEDAVFALDPVDANQVASDFRWQPPAPSGVSSVEASPSKSSGSREPLTAKAEKAKVD